MDKDIEQWQNLWEGQAAKPSDIGQVIQDLNKIERKGRRERIFMIFIFPLTIFLLLSVMPVLESPYYMASIIIMGLAMLMILVLALRNKYGVLVQSQEASNKAFLETQIKKLQGRMKITSFYMWIYAALLITGINIAYIEALHPLSMSIRLAAHIGVSVLLLVGMYFGIKQRMKRYAVEIEPLIEQLKVLNNG